jgi:rhamnulose-1-phosphate aldolase
MNLSLNDSRFEPLLEQISKVAEHIHSYGWAEANAGNISINVSSLFSPDEIGSKQLFLVSKTGSRYRQSALNPKENFLLVLSGKQSDVFLPNDAKPTSEWISHKCLQMQRPQFSVILHTHPAEIIALRQVPELQDIKLLNRILPEILPEFPLYLPEGIAMAPLCPPGSKALCDASTCVLKDEKALIWSGHGLLTFSNDLDFALDYMEIIVKACRVFFLYPDLLKRF